MCPQQDLPASTTGRSLSPYLRREVSGVRIRLALPTGQGGDGYQGSCLSHC